MLHSRVFTPMPLFERVLFVMRISVRESMHYIVYSTVKV